MSYRNIDPHTSFTEATSASSHLTTVPGPSLSSFFHLGAHLPRGYSSHPGFVTIHAAGRYHTHRHVWRM